MSRSSFLGLRTDFRHIAPFSAGINYKRSYVCTFTLSDAIKIIVEYLYAFWADYKNGKSPYRA